jgi:hypothetical protein
VSTVRAGRARAPNRVVVTAIEWDDFFVQKSSQTGAATRTQSVSTAPAIADGNYLNGKYPAARRRRTCRPGV